MVRLAVALTVAMGCRGGFDEVPDAAPRPDAACVPVVPPSPALVPSNGITSELLACVSANVGAVTVTFDTDTGAIPGVRAAGEGVNAGIGFAVAGSLGVFSADSFAVPPGATWTATGSRPLVLYAVSTIVVEGTLDVGSTDAIGGPGGGAGGVGDPRGSCEGKDGAYKFSLPAGAGAGGGGGATPGGNGADTAADVNGATMGGGGGVACSEPSTIPLTGGNGGGAGGSENMNVMGGTGGGGGGAVQLVAMKSITINGTVASPGAGGGSIASGKGGSGGGAGGAILIESPSVTLMGALTANGGAGARTENPTASDIRATRGHVVDAQPAAGTNGGGNGGAGTTLPTSGSTLTSGGGGGGAVGVIEIRAVTVNAPGLTSPSAKQSQAVIQ
jgi:hypothetical protein